MDVNAALGRSPDHDLMSKVFGSEFWVKVFGNQGFMLMVKGYGSRV
jgi:hypothetical protein